MEAATIYEAIGYIGSILIVASLAMSSIIRLRIVNLIGAIVFTIYGVLIGSIPVILSNVAISMLDVWYLWKDLSTREDLTVVVVDEQDAFLATFIDTHRDDLVSFADPSIPLDEADVRLVMLRDANLAGVFLGKRDADGSMRVIVDYVAPPYRDLRSGACLYVDSGARFAELGVEKLVVAAPDRRQSHYLTEMGYTHGYNGSVEKVIGDDAHV